jgi:hypothetical protein
MTVSECRAVDVVSRWILHGEVRDEEVQAALELLTTKSHRELFELRAEPVVSPAEVRGLWRRRVRR